MTAPKAETTGPTTRPVASTRTAVSAPSARSTPPASAAGGPAAGAIIIRPATRRIRGRRGSNGRLAPTAA